MDTTEARYKKLENEVRALKASYAISGALLPVQIIESEEYSTTEDSAIVGAATIYQKFTFVPDSDNGDVDLLTKMSVIYSVSIETEGYPTQVEGPFFQRDTDERDEDGNLTCTIKYRMWLPGGGIYPKYTMKAYAVATTLGPGSFTNEGGVV